MHLAVLGEDGCVVTALEDAHPSLLRLLFQRRCKRAGPGRSYGLLLRSRSVKCEHNLRSGSIL